MLTYLSMLRGINVGGQNKIKMEELKSLYESLGFKNIRTYIQSGNVIFGSAGKDTKELSNLIEEKIKEVFRLSVSVLLRTPAELQHIIDANPFINDKHIDTGKLYITFLSIAPKASALSEMKEIRGDPDKFYIVDREIYLYCPDGYGRTKFSNDFFERKSGIAATTRNWKLVNTLLEMTRDQE